MSALLFVAETWTLFSCDEKTSETFYMKWKDAKFSTYTGLSILPTQRYQLLAPAYLADELQRPADLEAQRRLRFTSSSPMTVRRTRLSTVGDRAFPLAAARTWNSLPQHVTFAPSMPVFRGRLKAFLFRRSFP